MHGVRGVALAAVLLAATAGVQAQSKLEQATGLIGQARVLAAGLDEVAQVDGKVDGLEYQRRTYGVLHQPELEAGLNEVLEELRAQVPDGAPPARVYATPAPTFEAYSFGDGTIVITAGVLESLESRDELAALIAHEYAHLLLGHHEQTRLGMLAEQAYGLGSLYLAYRFEGERFDATDLESTAMRQFALNELALESVQSGLVPRRSRTEEDDADRVGADLMIRAGYNHLAFDTLLTRMGEWEARNQRLAEQRDARAHEIGKWFKVERTGLSSDLKPVATALAGDIAQGASRLLGKLRRKHKDAGTRRDGLADYLDAEHPDAQYPELRALPWSGDASVGRLFADIAHTHQLRDMLDSGATGAARDAALQLQASSLAATPYTRFVLANLEPRGQVEALHQEVLRPDSLFTTHMLLLDLLERRDAEMAVQVLEHSRQLLGDPDDLLPYGVRLYQRTGNATTSAEYRTRCLASGNRHLHTTCRAQ